MFLFFIRATFPVAEDFDDIADAVGDAGDHGNVTVEFPAHRVDRVFEVCHFYFHFIDKAVEALHKDCRLVHEPAQKSRKPEGAEGQDNEEDVARLKHMKRVAHGGGRSLLTSG